MVLGDSLAHDTSCPGVGNWAMSSPTSAMMTWAARRPIPATSSRRSTTASAAARISPVWGSTRSMWPGTDRAGPDGVAGGCAVATARVGGWWAGGGNRRDRLLDPGGEPLDLAVQGVDLVQQHPGHEGVVLIEAAGQRRHQRGVLNAQ